MYRKRLRESNKEKKLQKHIKKKTLRNTQDFKRTQRNANTKVLKETHTKRTQRNSYRKRLQRNIYRKRLKETHNEQTCGQRQIFQPDRNVETPKLWLVKLLLVTKLDAQLKYSNDSLKSKLNCVNFVYLHQVDQILWLICQKYETGFFLSGSYSLN